MKKHLLWITPVTLGVGYFLFQPESISLETPMNTQDVLIVDKPTAHKEEPPEKKPKFELVPLPTQKPEQSACWDVQDKQRDIYLRAPKRILVPTAWRLYAQGHDKQEIAKAMTARSQQLEFAADWLRTVIVTEDVITHQHALKAYIFRAFDMDNKPTSNNLSDKRVDMYKTGEDILKTIDEIVTQYSARQQVSASPPQLGQMWSEVNFSGVEAALADRATGADIMYAIDEALKNIPEELLNSSISPINRLFVALLRSQHADTALALARRYPKAVYEQSGVLAFSTYEVLSFVAGHHDLTQNSEQISELVALSGLSDRNWASQKLFHGDVPQTAARKLKEIGIHISIDDFEALLDADEELVAEFGELPTLSAQDNAMLEACDGNQSWLNKRTKTPEQWLSYQQDEFTQRVVKSPEFAECTSSTTHSKSQGTISALNKKHDDLA
ncbi:hypothetical protein [Pseudoalteromonas sp. GB56]